MAKKEIVFFGISFIDLLSGALAAVLILFIIVPKLDLESLEASKKLSELGLKVDELDRMVEKLDQSIDRKLYEDIVNKIKEIKADLESSKKLVAKLEEEVQQLKTQVEDLIRYKQWMDNCGFTLEDKCPPKECPPTFEEWKEWMERYGFTPQSPTPKTNKQMGFEYSGEKVLYIIDVSGSMEEHGRLDKIKSGLHMLISTLDPSVMIDVIAFPDILSGNDFKASFESLKSANESNKNQLINFIYSLSPDGYTPTRETLKYAFNNPGYSGLTDIVLLSDGIPSIYYNGNNEKDDIYDILKMVKSINTNNVRINSVGVGSGFMDKSSTNEEVIFLRELAAQNQNGFFIGFKDK